MAVLAALKFKPNRRIMSEGLHIHSYLYSEPYGEEISAIMEILICLLLKAIVRHCGHELGYRNRVSYSAIPVFPIPLAICPGAEPTRRKSHSLEATPSPLRKSKASCCADSSSAIRRLSARLSSWTTSTTAQASDGLARHLLHSEDSV
jgi:hypothetical protein